MAWFTILAVPAGLQLYTVQDELAKDFEGTLRKVAAIGYEDVELPGLFGKTPSELRQLLADAGLRCRSAHLVYLGQLEIEKVIAAAMELKLRFLVAPIPWKRDPSGVQADAAGGPYAFIIGMVNSLTLDDWKWNADRWANRSGLRECSWHIITTISSSSRMTA